VVSQAHSIKVWFHHAGMFDQNCFGGSALDILNPCSQGYLIVPLSSLSHSFRKFWYIEKAPYPSVLDRFLAV